MIRTQVYLPDDLYHEAKAKAKLDNKSISIYMREGLKIALCSIPDKKKKSKKKEIFKRFIGKYSFPKVSPDAALNHNDIYDI